MLYFLDVRTYDRVASQCILYRFIQILFQFHELSYFVN
ncbi:hypothetical protein EVA_05398 [gut metagenome]|uniref:Uncharacterized protein n=1 Tax=gut metagenome TaxID=749906 RepID=J9GHG9_9ZZZZ